MELEEAISRYGDVTAKKLGEVAIMGGPEDQLRSPLEGLIEDLAALVGLDRSKLTVVGETSLAELQTRPDFAVSYLGTLAGFVEVKAPGKGADPRRFKDKHDRAQWKKLQALPNLIYTDGQAFSLWRDGELVAELVTLEGDISTSGSKLKAPGSLLNLFEDFLQWHPIAPRRPKQLAEMTARLSRLLRDEVTEQLGRGSPALTHLANDWRDLLFPLASDEEFADGYAQTVTFGLLLARARGISLDHGLGEAAKDLAQTHSLMGTALRVVTQSTESDNTLATSVATITRVLSVVDWPTVSKGDPRAWLYFYEDFLTAYDSKLRKETGSYYTPPEVVESMTRLVDEALITRFGCELGLADQQITVLDPAMGTGTFLLSVLRLIAERTEHDLGAGAVPGALRVALDRLVAFEIQLGPFAVAQLRVLAELSELGLTSVPAKALEFYVTNTLADPWIEETHLGQVYEPISRSRRKANILKKEHPIQVVLGNPPYKEKSKGLGGWVESGDPAAGYAAPLDDFMPPSDWGVSAHVKHLYNLYVYFWRWGTWKVFDHHSPDDDKGIVCYITVAGFLNGPGFQKMRAYLRERADAIWVIDCSPEGHRPAISTRIFQGVQHSVCITLVARNGTKALGEMAPVFYRQLAAGPRKQKFAELASLTLNGPGWSECSAGSRDPFLPLGSDKWLAFPILDDLLLWSGSGMMPGRTWVIDPDPATLKQRWNALLAAPESEMAALFMEHPTDRPITKTLNSNLPGFPDESVRTPIKNEDGSCPHPVRIGYRSLDRQWIIPDKRLINRPNPTLWELRSDQQVYLTALNRTSPKSGPGVTFTSELPDLDHYNGRGGRAFPLYISSGITNAVPDVLTEWSRRLRRVVTGEDLFAYIAGTAAHPGYSKLFGEHLVTPGLRIPLTADPARFVEAIDTGRRVLWLYTYGERLVDSVEDRPPGRPRLLDPPKLVTSIPDDEDNMPDTFQHDSQTNVLRVGAGVVSNVTTAMRDYEVSGVNVLDKWFSYRKKTRERPVIGSKERSALEQIHARRWQHSYTVELLDLLNVLGLLVELEPRQAALLVAIAEGPLVTTADLEAAGALPVDGALRNVPRGGVHGAGRLPV